MRQFKAVKKQPNKPAKSWSLTTPGAIVMFTIACFLAVILTSCNNTTAHLLNIQENENPVPEPKQTPADEPFPTATLPDLSNADCVPKDTRRQVGLVTRVIDGDTIEVAIKGITYKVRYIGVDTPEQDESFFKEATDLNRQMVSRQRVTLVVDTSETDRYNRLLRYVFVGDTFVNYELVQAGLARTVSFPPDTACYFKFAAASRGANEENIGIFSKKLPSP